jgi:acetolactate synthase-1/2/3 large subunit
VPTAHEQGAAHMADGYARATGRPGVCLVTSGPGATNTVTGLATAFMDSVPVVCITGQVATHADYARPFLETARAGASPAADWARALLS